MLLQIYNRFPQEGRVLVLLGLEMVYKSSLSCRRQKGVVVKFYHASLQNPKKIC
jgi:hypothetical protein